LTSTLTSPPPLEDKALAYRPEYYDAVYPNYAKQNPNYKYQHYLNAALKYHPQAGSWLDFGCAHGRFLNFLKTHSPLSPENLFGTDINPLGIQQAQLMFGEEQIRLGGRTALETPWQQVDVISALDVLEHLPDLPETLDAFHHQLNPGGILLAVMPVYDGPLGPVVHLLDKDPTHIHKKSRQFWVDLLGQRFDILAWNGIIRYLIPGGVYLNYPTNALKAIAPAVLVVCKKR
jgi:SAM-dependent methyltransferase